MAVVAERLRRLTRNQIPSGSAGSNPADCVNIFANKKLSLSSNLGLYSQQIIFFCNLQVVPIVLSLYLHKAFTFNWQTLQLIESLLSYEENTML